ncbi:MAG: AraC family transcriptional regulator [Chitinophagaceae bacterium]
MTSISLLMPPTSLLVKNMVCHRCVLAVEEILRNESIPFQKVIFGEIHLPGELSGDQKQSLQSKLNKIGFELIDTHTSGLIEKIKQLVIKRARNEVDEKDNKIKLSRYLSDHVNHEYTYLSSLFSSVEGRTIENYFIEQRIEKAKELLIYGQLTLSQIAFDLEYSSVAHLSTQFKKVTGLTPSYFKEVGASKRKSLDNI